MKKGIYSPILPVIILMSSLVACSTDDVIKDPNGADGKRKISLTGEIDQVAKTRVDDGGFCNRDVIGVYIVDYEGGNPGQLQKGGNRASNVPFTFDEPNYKWNGAYDIYWKDDKTPVDIYGYYPYGSPENLEAYAFEVVKDQSKAAVDGNPGGYEASDFLWGKATEVAPTTQVIKIAFRHKMSNALITLAEGTGFEAGEWQNLKKEILVNNTKRNATIDLATGEVTATGSVAPTGIIPFKKDDDFRAIVVPQSIPSGTKLFTITVDGMVYQFKKEEEFTYIPSRMHKFTIKVDKKANTGDYEFTLVSESITAWENDPISHDATAREYIVIHSTAGNLRDSIVAANKDYTKLQNLKIIGEINAHDFRFMRDTMEKLQALHLKEVKIKGCTYNDQWGTYTDGDDIIPRQAMLYKTSLINLVLPDKLKGIERGAFGDCKYLSGSLIIPEGVTKIGSYAFANCKSLTGSLSLPSTLEYIDGGDSGNQLGAFQDCGFVCELKLPENLTHIGMRCFAGCSGLYGSLTLPSKLTYIGEVAFNGCKNLTGSITIPQGVTEIHQSTFSFCGFNGTLTLHDGITAIGESAFQGCSLKGELYLPQNLTVINANVFNGCDFSGELKLPKNLSVIGDNAFAYNWRLMGVLEIPENVQSIGAGAFNDCRGIEGIIFPEGLENIRWESAWGDKGGAFSNCFGIGSIVCKGAIPPYVQSGAFNGVAKDNFTLEVPESAIQQYQTAVGWSDFKRIAAHRELVCRPSVANAINTECQRTLVLNAEGEWEVESKPDWCTLSAMNGNKKAELTLTIQTLAQGSAPREGDIVFKLKDKDYTTRCHVTQYNYEYGEDEILTLQQHSKGNGVNLVFLGDGYDAKDISEGNYLKDMKEQVENFFGIEPYKTYRDYFNVYTAIAVSPESGIGTINTIRYAKFGTTYTGGVGLKCDYDAAFAYALRMPTVTKANLHQSLVIITPNSSDYGGICQMWADGSAIAFCPKSDYGYPLDTRGVIQHEAGGHGFGKLGDEYIYHNEFIDFCTCTCCEHVFEFNLAKSYGWYANLSLTGKMHEVPWSHLIFDDRYSDIVDIFEGGFMHNRGVFRSEQNSCMNNDIPYYNTISREAIVKRIMDYAGETYSFETFAANDKITLEAGTKTTDRILPGISAQTYQHEPVIHQGKPNILK